MRHDIEASKAEQTTDQEEGGVATSQCSRELTDADLAHVTGGQKVREAAPPY